ncbi:unnamed protein product [Fusarium equiseti]|uniref:CCHC-type domain-containing protein n=1 Tax=Fusarium equiseti TaxID=61235 RepID=A0A8J2NKM1_FUSEQ|nr:unnamed protein product [Fusarium equiseti]
MSYHSAQIGNATGEAIAALHREGILGGGRRGGGGGGGDPGIRKGAKRCFHCGSEGHLVRDCPRKAKRVAQEAQQAASPPTPPPARPSTCPATTQSPVQETIDVRVGIILPPHGPQFAPLPAPPPAPEPRTGGPPARLGLEWSELFNRFYYVPFLDGSVEWYEEQR